MTTKKYMSLERLIEYNALLRAEIDKADNSVLLNAKSHSNSNLEVAKTYADNAVAQKSQVQIITWEDND